MAVPTHSNEEKILQMNVGDKRRYLKHLGFNSLSKSLKDSEVETQVQKVVWDQRYGPRTASFLGDFSVENLLQAGKLSPSDIKRNSPDVKKDDQQSAEVQSLPAELSGTATDLQSSEREELMKLRSQQKRRDEEEKKIKEMDLTKQQTIETYRRPKMSIDPPAAYWPEGCPKRGEWCDWLSRYTDWTIATAHEEEPERARISMLRCCIGDQAVRALDNFPGERTSYNDMLVVLDILFKPRRTQAYFSYVLSRRNQNPGESALDYASELRRLATPCRYDTMEKRILRDRFVAGIHSARARREILSVEVMSFDTAVDIAARFESAEKDSQDMKTELREPDINAIQRRRRKGNNFGREGRKLINCHRCGQRHLSGVRNCIARGKKCLKCKGRDHLTKCCRKGVQRQNDRGNVDGDVRRDEENRRDSKTYSVPGRREQFKNVDLLCEGQKLTVMIDTGSSSSFLCSRTVKKMGLWSRVTGCEENAIVFGGGEVRIIGRMTLKIKYNGQVKEEEFKVVDNGIDLLGLVAIEHLKLLTWDKGLRINKIKLENKFDNVYFYLELKPGFKPFNCKPRSIPYSLRDKVNIELNKLIKSGVLVPSEVSDWASPIVVVLKKCGNVRICGDFRRLNQAIKADKYPLPNIEDLLASIGPNNKFFSKLDLQAAYHQIKLTKESQALTTIVTPMGTYKYTRMPYGIKSAPSAFQRIMTDMLRDHTGVLCYMDDILIAASDRETLKERLHKVRTTLNNYKIVVNEDKSVSECEQVEWLGYQISKAGIRPSKEKTLAIEKLQIPKTVKEVRQIMGVVNYYSKFVQNFAAIADPIHQLLKKNVKFGWTVDRQQSFDKIKEEICKRTALAPFQTNKRKVVLKCDACDTGLGAVLEQQQPNGVMAPVVFWSSKFRSYESNYSIGEKEALACVAATSKFRKYLLGRHFILQTDHRALQTLLSQTSNKRTMARVERWKQKLGIFDYTVQYIRGETNSVADLLSRTACSTDHTEVRLNEELVCNSIKETKPDLYTDYEDRLVRLTECVKKNLWTQQDQLDLAEYYKNKNALTEHRGKVYYKQSRYLPSARVRPQIITEAHKVHQGITKTRLRIAEYFWWPHWTTQVESFIRQCSICDYSDRTKKTPHAPLKPVPLPHRPWDKIALDLKGPIAGSKYKYLLVIMDYYSKWPEVIGVKTITAINIINKLKQLFSRYGIPKVVVSDNGTQFVAKETSMFFEQLKIQHHKVALYAPHQNGLVERFNKILAERIAESKKMGWNLDQTLQAVLFHYRSTPHVTTNISPFEAFFGRKMRNAMSMLSEKDKQKTKCIRRDLYNKKISKSKLYVDKHRGTKNRKFRIGMWVRVKDHTGHFGHPIKIIKVTGTSVITTDNKKWSANRVAICKLAAYQPALRKEV